MMIIVSSGLQNFAPKFPSLMFYTCKLIFSDEAEDPAGIPIYWVSKWVDYSDKYGLGYQLCDNSVGVLFNDSTRLILLANGE